MDAMDTIMNFSNGAMPTPPASSVAPSSLTSPLPHPRRHPLKPGSPKESELIRYLDQGINNVQLRVDNRSTNASRRPIGVEGYQHFGEVEKDLEALIDVVWVSGSPNLQVPYLWNIARLVSEFLPLFPASPRPTFRLLDKLDVAFASLLIGKDIDSGEALPGFESGRTISVTDKVRLKGIVDRARLVVARRMGDGPIDEEGDDTGMDGEPMTEIEDDTVKFEGFENNDDEDMDDGDDEAWEEQQIGKVFERTIGELGDVLGGPPIGIITEE